MEADTLKEELELISRPRVFSYELAQDRRAWGVVMPAQPTSY